MPGTLIWIYTLGAAALFILCDSLAAHWGKTQSWVSLAIVLVLGPFAYILFGLLNESKSLAVSSGMVNIMLIIGTVLVSVFVFKESLTLREWIGLGFGVIALVLMNSK